MLSQYILAHIYWHDIHLICTSKHRLVDELLTLLELFDAVFHHNILKPNKDIVRKTKKLSSQNKWSQVKVIVLQIFSRPMQPPGKLLSLIMKKCFVKKPLASKNLIDWDKIGFHLNLSHYFINTNDICTSLLTKL